MPHRQHFSRGYLHVVVPLQIRDPMSNVPIVFTCLKFLRPVYTENRGRELARKGKEMSAARKAVKVNVLPVLPRGLLQLGQWLHMATFGRDLDLKLRS